MALEFIRRTEEGLGAFFSGVFVLLDFFVGVFVWLVWICWWFFLGGEGLV